MQLSGLTTFIAALALAVSSVQAHATCNPNIAPNGQYFVTSIRIPHSFPGSYTLNVSVKIPDGVNTVIPRELSGWKVDFTMRPLNPPVVVDDVGIVNTTVDTVIWYGGQLLNGLYEDFSISMMLPNVTEGTKLYFPTTQITTNSTGIKVPLVWDAIPYPNGTLPDGADDPAPSLTLYTNGVVPSPSPSTAAKSSGHKATGAVAACLLAVASLMSLML
ncbi:uncharacterized protein BJ171DRAFT_597151 [Polychytrium aggregatum]|uniref:uncharacterized protein n=1 Tax=Polychytrium aggregatum TaxID=110093 RepID=UPI0022FE01C7|nr:uncharacterized protein BJ171DRAFT_597151 [Polychytrium aggregatum]KAI9207041.1 hypothetical protein BJ171DRAFT_597151 [Polychytrium aggregatum]